MALWSSDGSLELYRAEDERSNSLSSANLQHGTSTLEVGGRSLTSLMEENGHHRIDLLKMDVEGAEYDVLESVDVAALGVAVLCVEFHATVPVKRARGILAGLRERGLAVAHIDGPDYTLVRVAAAGVPS